MKVDLFQLRDLMANKANTPEEAETIAREFALRPIDPDQSLLQVDITFDDGNSNY
eukprot:CAMPEP_0202962484 /NCGR_PEP_ID=MMETSP1396-20130829/6596_1 /ASSEMBLY_ACC=CAM_ASM_000872 /TAXON_ID= /ORGANISM="Pseudokeronopsis sp., Strain Brazil" /LENGTH=54 /DNA_ID=CAMNT_0049683111 /DNA_START=4521 /DNA_END=4685 /DNA_ORIENTATION=-